MIIGCNSTRKVGQYYTGQIKDNQLQLHSDVRYYVVREATYDEWLKSYEEETGKKLGGAEKIWAAVNGHFYQISID